MQFISCPETNCPKTYRVLNMAPDETYLTLMWHFFHIHPEACPLELLDSTDEIKVSNKG